LTSQFEALEEPEDALTVDVSATPEEMVESIVSELELRKS
jgi:gluconate kinase